MGVAAVFAKRAYGKRGVRVVRSGESGWASFCGVCVCAVGDLVRETNEHGGYGIGGDGHWLVGSVGVV